MRKYRFLTHNQTNEERERFWFELIESVAPGIDQIDFTPEHWQLIIERVTLREGGAQ